MKNPKTLKDAVCSQCLGKGQVETGGEGCQKTYEKCPKCFGKGYSLPPKNLLTK